MAVEQPQEAGLIYPGERSIVVAAEEVIWSPAERSGDAAKPAAEKSSRVIDEALPTAHRYVRGGPAGVEPSEALSPFARDFAVTLGDRGTLFLRIA
jgi:hypothetical protein